mgnify:CR=1 FL=1
MANLMIPEELAPLTNFNWSQFSDTYAENHDIQLEPHVAIQLETGVPGGGTKVVVDVKDVPIGWTGYLPNTNRVHLHAWCETSAHGENRVGGYCTYNGDGYKIIRRMDEQPFDGLFDEEPYTIEQMVQEFTTEVRGYLHYGNYRYDAVYDAVAQSVAELRSLHEDNIMDVFDEEYHREDVDGVRTTFYAYGEKQTIYGEFVHEPHKTPYARAYYNGVACVIDCPLERYPEASPEITEFKITKELSTFLSKELEPAVDEICGKHIAGDLDQSAPEL